MSSSKNDITPMPIFPNIDNEGGWETWMYSVEIALADLGYKKDHHKHKGEAFSYWKKFNPSKNRSYQIGVSFYDFRKYSDGNINNNAISVQYKCLLDDGQGRIDLDVSKDISLEEFEGMAKTFYDTMNVYCILLKND